MMVQGPDMGRLGLLPDQPKQKIPLGGWESGRNIRSHNGYLERIREPVKLLDTDLSGEWLQLYEDTSGPRQAYASQGRLYRRTLTGDTWEDVTNPLYTDYSDGEWHSFQYGTSVVFNNGIEPPQILYANASTFVDLPNWGLVTEVEGEDPVQRLVTCKALRLYGVYMVAMDLTIDGTRSQNGVWTSDPAIIDNVSSDAEMPSWDYASPATRSTLNYLGVEYGAIVDGLELNNNFMVYTRESAHVLQLVGGTFVFTNRLAVPYGLASLGAVARYNNLHFVIAPSTIYVHDGSTVKEIADGRINRQFFSNLQDLNNIHCVENQEFREIHTLCDSLEGKSYLIYSYDDDAFSWGDAVVGADDVVCMAYGLAPPGDVETYSTIATTYATEARTYSQMAKDGEQREMFWLTGNALHIAETSNDSDTAKTYYVERFGWDFSEMSPQVTTDKIKLLSTIIPHITGIAQTKITVYASDNLREASYRQEEIIYDPTSMYKADFRITGRWLGLRLELTTNGQWEMSSMDFDVEPIYGR